MLIRFRSSTSSSILDLLRHGTKESCVLDSTAKAEAEKRKRNDALKAYALR